VRSLFFEKSGHFFFEETIVVTFFFSEEKLNNRWMENVQPPDDQNTHITTIAQSAISLIN
jgi:hypothetical protein